MTLNEMLSLKKDLLVQKQKLINGFKTQDSDIKLFVVNVAIDELEKQIQALKSQVTYH